MERYAMVTGGNRGIGFETSRQLALAGFRVVLTSRLEPEGKEAARILRSEGLNIDYHQLDVTDPDQIEDMMSYLEKEAGRMDVLVNNAGVDLDEGKMLLEIPEKILRETLEVNFFGAFRLTRAVIPLMKAQKYGRIVNVSSGYGSLNSMTGRTGAYKISKAALNALTRIVAGEVNPGHIKVNCVNPGWVRTRMGGSGAPRSPLEATETILWLATLPESGPTGGFFGDKRQVPW